jgi:hypothetical protein
MKHVSGAIHRSGSRYFALQNFASSVRSSVREGLASILRVGIAKPIQNALMSLYGEFPMALCISNS